MKIDYGANKVSQIQNRHFKIRCGNQSNGNSYQQIFWEIATGDTHSNYEYLQIGWKDSTTGELPGWFGVNIAAQHAININGGTQGVLVTGSA
eukprot:3890450-Prymnesium_polylepis.1